VVSDVINDTNGAAAPSALPDRQRQLTAWLRCHYATDAGKAVRPHCQGVAVVEYGPMALCATCDAMRSAVGRTQVGRPLPGPELAALVDAARALAVAEQAVVDAVTRARAAGASWAHIGDALGLTRQGAQQRWGR
jgi:hypothetical protein